jgi:hypothetical protein
MPAVKNAAGIRAAKQIATEAAKGSAIVSILFSKRHEKHH